MYSDSRCAFLVVRYFDLDTECIVHCWGLVNIFSNQNWEIFQIPTRNIEKFPGFYPKIGKMFRCRPRTMKNYQFQPGKRKNCRVPTWKLDLGSLKAFKNTICPKNVILNISIFIG